MQAFWKAKNFGWCPSSSTIIFTSVPFYFLSVIGKKGLCCFEENRLCRDWHLNRSWKMSPDILTNFFKLEEKTLFFWVNISVFRYLSITKPGLPGYEQVEPLMQYWSRAGHLPTDGVGLGSTPKKQHQKHYSFLNCLVWNEILSVLSQVHALPSCFYHPGTPWVRRLCCFNTHNGSMRYSSSGVSVGKQTWSSAFCK